MRDAAKMRRWRPSWSLLLQLLAVGAFALALAQPSLQRPAPANLVLLIDASASMRALHPEGEPLARARTTALELAASADHVAVIRVGVEAELLLPFTRDANAVRSSIEAIAAGDARASFEDAIALARSLAATLEPTRVVLLTDQTATIVDGVDVVALGGSGRNVGITAFDVSEQLAFVAVAGNHARPVEVQVVVETLAGDTLARAPMLIPASGRNAVTLPMANPGGIVRARLEFAGVQDVLDLDNVAFAGRETLRVLMDQDEENVRRALGAIPGVSVQVTGRARFMPADMHVLTGANPDDLPAGFTLLLPPLARETTTTRVGDWSRTHPLLRFVDLRETSVALAPLSNPIRPLPWLSDQAQLEAAGWRVLASSRELRPLIAERTQAATTVVALGVHPLQSDLIYRTAFPTFIANVVDAARGLSRASLGVRGDDGARVLTPGVVVVDGRALAVSLLRESETRLEGAALALAAPTGSTASSERDFAPVFTPTPIARVLLVIALLALLLEWWGWSRGAAVTATRWRWRAR